MSGSRWMMAVGIGALLLVGCDDKATPAHADRTSAQASATTQPAEQASAVITPAETAPTTQPSQEGRSFTIVENNIRRTLDFPSARLHIDKQEKTAVLYSDDPKIAINSNYAGNSYYLVIPLTDEFLDHLDGFRWNFKAASSDRQDSVEGIFLEGQRYHLQPSAMVIGFEGDGPKVRVGLDGDFFKFDMGQSQQLGSLVTVQGIVNATVDVAK